MLNRREFLQTVSGLALASLIPSTALAENFINVNEEEVWKRYVEEYFVHSLVRKIKEDSVDPRTIPLENIRMFYETMSNGRHSFIGTITYIDGRLIGSSVDFKPSLQPNLNIDDFKNTLYSKLISALYI